MQQAGTVAPVARGRALRSGQVSTFRALRNRNYRYLWLGQLGHSASQWMEQVVRPLLMLHLTGSALQVGLVVAIRMVPLLALGLLAGVVADRYDKRRVLMYSQAVTLLAHLVLGLLLISDLIRPWHVFFTAFISGGAMAFNQPARQSILPRLVPREDLLNAVALNNAAMNIMRVGGAGLAGLLLVLFDFGQVYLLNALIYVGVIWTTLRMVIPEDGAGGRPGMSFFGDLLEGFRYLGTNRQIIYLVAMAFILFIFGQPYQQVFVPLLATQVLGIDRAGVGGMLAITGLGALLGSLTVASQTRVPRRGVVMMGALAVFSLALILLAESPWLLVSLLALLVAGSMTVTYMALNNSLLLEQTPLAFHGRVMSLMSLDRGVIPIGAILAGVLAQSMGPQLGLTIMALLCLSLTALTYLFVPVLRKMA